MFSEVIFLDHLKEPMDVNDIQLPQKLPAFAGEPEKYTFDQLKVFKLYHDSIDYYS